MKDSRFAIVTGTSSGIGYDGILAEQHRKQAEPGSAPPDAPAATRTAGR